MNHITQTERGTASHDARDLRPEAARKRLRECRDSRHACEAIREIVSNLLGCEEMALLRVDRRSRRLSVIWSFGIQTHAHLPASLAHPEFFGVLAGEIRVNENATHLTRSHPSAFVPIRFDGATVGLLVLMRLLPQKTKIDELDRRLLSVISSEAGKSLFGAQSSGNARQERKR